MNKHYGIYEWEHIYKLCNEDINAPIRVLKFSETELFGNPISLSEVHNIFQQNGKRPNTFASPVRINNIIFNQIYNIGTWGK